MSFNIVLQTNASDDRCLTKSLSTITTISGTLKDTTSMINPTIIIETSQVNISNLNYLTISDFKRSYFVKEIKSVKQNLWEISCHVDVLSSFANQIKSNTAIVNRQENKWNLFLNDDSIRCYQNPTIVTREFPAGFTPNSPSYILLVAGCPTS